MFEINTTKILLIALMFIRVGGVIYALPIFGEEQVPVRVKILLGGALTFALYPIVFETWSAGQFASLNHIENFILLIARELFIGLTLGYVAKLMIDGILMASNLVGFQMGFGTAQLFLPTADDKVTSFMALNHILIIMIFLALNYHHIYIQAIYESFKVIPLGLAWPKARFFEFIVPLSASMFVSAIQLAAPIVVALLFSTMALGLIARTVPQVNVFIVSFPVNFYLGIVIYIATLPLMPGWLMTHFSGLSDSLNKTLTVLVR